MTRHYRYNWLRSPFDARDHAFEYQRSGKTPPRKLMPPPSVGSAYDQGQEGSCHDDKTEVLTDGGFKLFSQLDGSERLATVNPDTAELHFEVPTRLVRFPYKGELHCIANESLNFRVTPDHKMLVRKWDERARTLSETYEFVAAKDIGWYAGLMSRVKWAGESHGNAYTLPGIDHKHIEQRTPKDVPMAAWLRFLGIYLAEGTMLKRDQQAGKASYKVQIAASKEREKQFVRTALEEIGVRALELADRFTFENRRIYEAMTALGLEGVKAGGKFVPAFVFRQSGAMIAEFLSGHFAGDGCLAGVTRNHYTGSAQLARDLQTLVFLSGSETRMFVREARTSMFAGGRTAVGTLPEHRISVCERKNLSIERKKNWRIEQYDGEVFCAEVPTFHTLVTRREGKILVSGNCTANALARVARALGVHPDPSRQFIYDGERLIEGTRLTADSGAFGRDGAKLLHKVGVCSEAAFPYNHRDMVTRPPVAAYTEAATHRISGYRHIYSVGSLIDALAAGNLVPFGFQVPASFESQQVASTGILNMPAPGEQFVGGHEVFACGYDLDANIAFCGNSWSDSWGMRLKLADGIERGGFFTVPLPFLASRKLCDDFIVLER